MKRFLVILLALLCCLSLASCGFLGKWSESGSETDTHGEAESDTPHGNEGEAPVYIVSDNVSEYSIVYPESSTGEEMLAVNDVYNVFNKKTGVKLGRDDDYLKDGESREETYKILVGRTNYGLSATAYEGLRYHEYRILTDRTCIAVAAYSFEGFSAAMAYIEENLLSGFSDGKLKLRSIDVKAAAIEDYDVDSWTIGGNELKNYKLVYADGIDRAQMIALRNDIAKKTGWFLEVVSDKEAESGKYEILIGDTNREESVQTTVDALSFTVKTVNDKLVIKTGGVRSFDLLMEDFDGFVIQGEEKIKMGDGYEQTGDFYDDPNNVLVHKDANIRILDANVQANRKDYMEEDTAAFGFDRRLEIFFAALDFYQPTVVGLQEFCMSWYQGVEQYQHIDKWEILKFQNPNLPAEYVLTTIMYRKDLLTLVDSGMTYYSAFNNGRCRAITWAVLRDNATDKEFCFISTHWDGGNGDINGETENTMVQVGELSAFVKKMSEKYPVFTTGDFNRNEYTNAFKTYLSNIKSVDAMYGAEQRLNVLGSYHGWGKNTASAGSCDHITATKDTTVLKFETLMYNQQIYASDHAWLIADIKFN